MIVNTRSLFVVRVTFAGQSRDVSLPLTLMIIHSHSLSRYFLAKDTISFFALPHPISP